MSRYAIISDIHGNLQALETVLYAIADLDVHEVVCLGDIVGYGPAPDACIDLVTRCCSITVRGNHDEAVIDPVIASEFNGAAQEAIHWTRRVLGPLHLNALTRLKQFEYIGEEIMCVHDCPAPAPTDYVHDKVIASMAFIGVDRPICLLGHTHVPIVFEAEAMNGRILKAVDLIAHLPRDGEPIQLSPEKRFICNPGSVGQPRDADPRASFAVLDMDEWTFTVHRREYDIASVQRDTLRVGLPVILADRLAIGA
jgi:predicted phosphodiesterase